MNSEEKNIDIFCLRQTDYKDYDVIVNGISTSGKYYTFFARGIRKPSSKNASALQPFVLSNIQYFESNKEMHMLKSASPIKNYYEDFSDYDQMLCAHVIVEVISDISHLMGQEEQSVYTLLLETLKYVPKVSDKLLLSSFISRVMKLIGLELVCDECAHCKSKQVNYISLQHGGFVCHDCLSDNNVAVHSIETLKLFRLIQKVSYDKLENLEADDSDLEQLLMVFYEFYVSYSGLRIKNIKHFINSDVIMNF